MARFSLTSAALIAGCAGGVAVGQPAALHALPGGTPVYPRTEAYQISADGSTVVGMSIGAHSTAGTAWSNTGEVATALCCQIGAAFTHASDNGQVYAGWLLDSVPGGASIVKRPIRLERQFAIYDIFGEGVGNPDDDVLPAGISANGQLLAFAASSALTPQASRIFDGVFANTVQLFPVGGFRPVAMSANAQVVVGLAGGPPPQAGLIWTSGAGFLSLYDWAGGCGGLSEPMAVGMNRTGATLVGSAWDGLAQRRVPVRMGAAGISGLSTCAGEARDASSDAGVIVGQLACAAGEPRAFVWTQSAGVRLVTDVLGDAGVSVSGWILLRANGVSDDGRIIVGEGIFDGDVRGWVAHLLSGPMCDSIDFNNDGSLFDPTDVDAFLSVFSEGSCVPSTATCNDVDFNNDGSLFDPQDIDAFLSVFSEGPCL